MSLEATILIEVILADPKQSSVVKTTIDFALKNKINAAHIYKSTQTLENLLRAF